MSTHDFRLLRLERRLPRRPSPAPATTINPARLSGAEYDEFLALMDRVRPLPGGRWDCAALGDDELDRAVHLYRRAEGLPVEEAR